MEEKLIEYLYVTGQLDEYFGLKEEKDCEEEQDIEQEEEQNSRSR